jgi:hypothetical protein
MGARNWPDWWEWELEFSPHLVKRMADRDFTETDLRTMLQDAEGWAPTPNPDRYLIRCRLAGRAWNVVVEPDAAERLQVVVTAYPA